MNQHSKEIRTKHEEDESELNNYTKEKLLSFPTKVNNNNNNKKQSNKNICPFACPNCQSLGEDLVRSKYEIVNILSDTGASIFSPFYERYHDYNEDHRSAAVRNGSCKVFLSADLVIDSFFQQQNFKNR